jgi:hypothetical protein
VGGRANFRTLQTWQMKRIRKIWILINRLPVGQGRKIGLKCVLNTGNLWNNIKLNGACYNVAYALRLIIPHCFFIILVYVRGNRVNGNKQRIGYAGSEGKLTQDHDGEEIPLN